MKGRERDTSARAVMTHRAPANFVGIAEKTAKNADILPGCLPPDRRWNPRASKNRSGVNTIRTASKVGMAAERLKNIGT